jgi:AraC-like DNA-binding protein
VREVAINVGFADDSTLVRQMRRWTRRTTGQVRAGAVAVRLAENYMQASQ